MFNSEDQSIKCYHYKTRLIGNIFLLLVLFVLATMSNLHGQFKTEWADTVILGNDSLPYNIPKSNMLIIIDDNLSTTGSAILNDNKDDIMILGTGDTLRYGTSGAKNVNAYQQSWGTPRRCQIKNLVLFHDIDSLKADTASGCDAIECLSGDSLWMDSLVIIVNGYHASCFDGNSQPGNGVANILMTNCKDSSAVHSQSSRTSYVNAAIRAFSSTKALSDNEYTLKLYNVTVPVSNHCAVYVSNSGSELPRLIMNHCSLSVDTRNYKYENESGDPFAITSYKLAPGSIVCSTFVRSGTEFWGGNGIFLQGSRGTEENPIKIFDNDVRVSFGRQNTYSEKSIALYVRWDEGGNYNYNQHTKITNNTFVAYGDKDNLTDYLPPSIQTVRIHLDSGFQYNEFSNNRVFALRVDSLIDTGDVFVAAAQFAGMDSTREEKTILGLETHDVVGNVFKNNYYYSNDGDPFHLGCLASHEHGGGGMTFVNDTIHRGENSNNGAAVVFSQSGTYRYSSTGSRLIDPVFLGYASDTAIFRTITQDDDSRGKDIRFQRIVEITTLDSSLFSIPNIELWIINNYGDTVSYGFSDQSGSYVDTVTYKALHYNSPASDNTWYDSLTYNNFRVVAKSGSDSAVSILAIDEETTFPITLTLNGGGSANSAPSAPSASSPANGAVLTDLTPALILTNANDPDGDNLSYTFQVSTNSSFTNIVAQTSSYPEGGGSTTTWNVSPTLSEGTYYWRTRAYDGQLYSNYSSIRSFSIAIANSAPTTPTASLPSNGASINDLNPVLVINNSSDADSNELTYNFQVATNSTFSNIVSNMPAYPEGGGTTTAWAVSPALNNGSSYYWRARAYDGQDYSGWSTVRTFSIAIQNSAPNAPVPVSPEDSADIAETNPSLIINNSYDVNGDNLTYSFEISANVSFTELVGSTTGYAEGAGSTTSWTATSALNAGSTYYWRARANDGQDNSNWSTVRVFSIIAPNSPPSTPLLATPANGSQITAVRPYLTINNSSDSDGDPLTYHFQVSTSSIFSSISVETLNQSQGGGSTTTWQVSSNLNDGNTYFWRVRAYDGEEYSNWSGSRSFIVNLPNNPPTIPSLLNPAHASIVNTIDPLLTILNSSDPDNDIITYHFQVAVNASSTIIAAETTNQAREAGDSTSWQVSPELSDKATYYWRVRAYDGEDYSNWTSAWSFTIDLPNNPPSQPALSAPANGAYVQTAQPELIVNNSSDADGDALTYRFEVSSTSNFSAIVQQSSAISQSAGSTTSWTVGSDLNNHINYWWRVRCYDGEDFSAYSQTRVFYTDYTTPNDPPSPPEPDDPPDGSTVDTTMPVLVVNNATDLDGDELSYHFEVWDELKESKITASPAISEGADSTTSWQVDTALENGSHYFWRTRAYDGADSADWTGWCDFEVAPASPTNTAPSTPIVHSPADTEILLGNSHNLIIYNSVDPEEDQLTYQFKVCTDASMTNVMEEDNSVAEGAGDTTIYSTTAMYDDGNTYYWSVRAFDGELYSDWNTPFSFVHYSLAVDAENIPIPLAPLEGDEVSSAKPKFEISVDETGENIQYYFEVADNPEFTMAISSGPVNGKRPITTWMPDQNLSSNRNYYWRVKSESSGWSETISFYMSGDVHLSPNPYRFKKHDQVVFHNLPQNSNIQILTISGEMVNEFSGIQDIDYNWDVTNEQGQPLASGVYLYYVSSSKGQSSGKFAVIK